ncbi:MAG: hypothetical protein MJ201_05165 [Mycoplasmoidaceae bacterium]|nr:hypothetical protein [Mycoplasmoidaceae bacterium]
MKRKFILLPITLTTLTPAISLVACGDSKVVLDQWQKVFDAEKFYIFSYVNVNKESNYHAVIDTNKLGIDKMGFVAGQLSAIEPTKKKRVNVKIDHFYVGDLELFEKESYIEGETNYYYYFTKSSPVFFHEIKENDIIVVDFHLGINSGYTVEGEFGIEFFKAPQTK